MKLQNKSIVVTGASSGMGKHIVELFVNEGASVVAVARRAERLEALKESLKDAPGKLVVFAGAVYCASKAAVNAYSRHVAFTYMKEGIRSNIIAPGGISTEIGTAMGMPNMDGFSRVRPVQALAPAPGQTSDIANTALFLASDDSAYVNGVVLPVDGGWTAF